MEPQPIVAWQTSPEPCMQNVLNVSENNLMKVSELLKSNGVIGYPTETVYGLGCIPDDAEAVARIIRLKQRDDKHPMLILIPDQSFLSSIVYDVSEAAFQLMDRFWPGPLTLIFKAQTAFPASLTGPDGSIGLRISSDPVCQDLMMRVKKPIVSTSANPGGMAPARSASEVFRYFGSQIDIILDGGVRNRNRPSTVLDIRTTPAKLLRKGAVKSADIGQVIGAVIETDNL